MSVFVQMLVRILLVTIAAGPAVIPAAAAQERVAIDSRFAEVNGTRLHYLIAGSGEPVLLLHGYAQTSHMWRPLIAELAETTPSLRPICAGSARRPSRKVATTRSRWREEVHALAASSDRSGFGVAGHDIGLMVAYAYAAQYPAEVDRIVLMDAFLPGVGRLDERLAPPGICGTSTSTARRLSPSSTGASGSTSSTSGTTSPPIPPSPSPRRIAGSTRPPTRSRAECARGSRCSVPSSRMRRTSPISAGSS